MNDETDESITEMLLSIKNYIDAAIQNAPTQPQANKKTFVELRLKNHVSIARIAVLLSKPAQYVTELESGAERLLVADALKLGQFYGVSADSLI